MIPSRNANSGKAILVVGVRRPRHTARLGYGLRCVRLRRDTTPDSPAMTSDRERWARSAAACGDDRRTG
jgi:hypothetical protein